jgi:septum formation protein
MRWILGSASPRRRELLANLGVEFEVIAPEVDEQALLQGHSSPPLTEADASSLVRHIAESKARAAAALTSHPDALVIAADTIVFLHGHPLGKPTSRSHARAMLESLSGQQHQVCTGLALLDVATQQCLSEAVTTHVTFRPLTEACMEAYLSTGEHADKAGAYGIQGLGGTLVERVDGCYFNVVGLPVMALCSACERLGHPIFKQWPAATQRV